VSETDAAELANQAAADRETVRTPLTLLVAAQIMARWENPKHPPVTPERRTELCDVIAMMWLQAGKKFS